MKQVLNLTDEQKHNIKTQYMLLCKDKLLEREYKNDDFSPRNNYQRDYARILYSPSFRRLQGKMQIVGVNASAFYRNRLTHSLEVAQIATSIAKMLSDTIGEMYSFEDIYVIEAAALAHDIGHPAFGHKGERVLNEIAKAHGLHFEGNAQNYRVLRHLEKKEHGHCGLNLTNRTLLAINKYIVKEGDDIKKFMFSSDYDYLMSVRKEVEGLSDVRTLDAQIIELADDIAYAVHDLEDGLSLRNFAINEVLFMLNKKSEESYQLFMEIVDECMRYANDSKIENVQDHSKLFRMRLTSNLTNLFVQDITIARITKEEAEEHGTKDYFELSLDKYKCLLKDLKNVVFECTIRDNDVQLYEMRGEIVLKSLFSVYSDAEANEDGKLMPPDYRPKTSYMKCKDEDAKKQYKKDLAQNAIDYIAGMMDTYAKEEYERLFDVKFDKISLENIKKDSDE